jgi:hypothetical protein
MKERIRPSRLLVAFIEALVISWALLYLGEYFGWDWVREAGGLVLGTVL